MGDALELVEQKMPMWDLSQFSVEALKEKYLNPDYYIGYKNKKPFGGFLLIEKDERYWPGNADPAFYFHKFVVDCDFAGQGLSGCEFKLGQSRVDKISQPSLTNGQLCA